MPTQTFIVNGETVSVDVEDDVRLLWVLRDLLGVTGPKYGCGLSICQACTSHINGVTFNPCAVPVGDLRPDDEIVTIEGLADTVDGDLHPVQQAWLDHDVAQCGFCQPGQIMAAVGLIEEANAAGREITDADLDALRNMCRCGTYPRARNAIRAAQATMTAPAVPAVPETPAAPEVLDDVVTAAVPETAATGTLPVTGTESLLGGALAAGGVAVAIRGLAGKSGRVDPAE